MQVRHFGVLHASGALPLTTIRLMIVPAHPSDDPLPQRQPPPPRMARCPTGGTAMRIVMRRWTSSRDLVDTSGEPCRGPDERRAIQCGPLTAPVRPSAGLRQHQAAETRSATACQRPAAMPRGALDVPMAMPHHGVRRTIPTLRERHTLEDPLAAMRGFLEPRIEATARVASILISSARYGKKDSHQAGASPSYNRRSLLLP
jgi:hypothetical protein